MSLRKPHLRTLLIAGLVIVAISAGAALTRVLRTTRSESADGYQPYAGFDTSDFAAVSTQMPLAPVGAGLDDIAKIWTKPGAYLAMGIGKATGIATLEVHWPTSGVTQEYRNLPVNRAVEIVEFADTVRYLPRKRLPPAGGAPAL